MKYLFALTLIACVTLLAAGQTPSGSVPDSKCTLTPEQSPEIRGVRLGMTTEQLQNMFPEEGNLETLNNAIAMAKQAQAYGASSADLRPDRKTANPRFAGLDHITVRLLDDRVITFHVMYSPTEWNSVGQFLARLSEAFRLPRASWELGDESGFLKCNGFRVEAWASKNSTHSTVSVRNTSVDNVVEDRKEAAREKVRQAFKP